MIHTDDSQYLEPDQARTAPNTPYDDKLAGALREIFASGAHALDAVVSGLNGMGIHAPDGNPWTGESFTAEMSVKGA
ncbi:recombinase-like helix-turn-helix domain-containing protein [Tsukamurella sp. 1534]|uniref:recombinase-like helix-turn-helix domain-containing protein n=1 Tax=Tsukamurella sp. 1534 TaxID=1151061 RepID=UPI0002D5C7C8|nr:recombinase-like helix-turn-helix domain-containing protein [Tsukamurella sp. 1534]